MSQSFWDDETWDETGERVYLEFEADRALLAHAITKRYGPPQRKDLRPYFGSGPTR